MKNFLTVLFNVFNLLLVLPVFAQEQEVTVTHKSDLGIGAAKKMIDTIVEYTVRYSFQVLGGIVILVLGWIVANFAAKIARNFLIKHKVDLPVMKFMIGTLKLIIMAFAVIIALGKFGVEIAPFIAGLSVVGFGTSFALQGPLSNYAAGASLIFTKPFKVGDIIEVAGIMGEVEDMSLPSTEVRTIDGTKIFVPNKHIIGEIIHNFSNLKKLTIIVGVSYKSDINKVISVLEDIIRQEPRVAKQAQPKVGIGEFGDSSVNMEVLVRCKQADYCDVRFALNKRIFEEFAKQGIEIPFPQRDVHIIDRTK